MRSLRFWKGKESNHRQGNRGASTVSIIFCLWGKIILSTYGKMLRFVKAKQWVFVVILFIILLISKMSKLHRNSRKIEKASSMCLQKSVWESSQWSRRSSRIWRNEFKIGWKLFIRKEKVQNSIVSRSWTPLIPWAQEIYNYIWNNSLSRRSENWMNRPCTTKAKMTASRQVIEAERRAHQGKMHTPAAVILTQRDHKRMNLFPKEQGIVAPHQPLDPTWERKSVKHPKHLALKNQ